MVTIIVMYLIGVIPLTIINYIMPSLLRKNVFFGVTVPNNAKKEPELSNILRQYKKRILLGTTILSVVYFITAFILPIKRISTALLTVVFLYIVYFYIIYTSAWRKTKIIKKQKNWDIQSKNIAVANLNVNALKTRLSLKWFILYPIIILSTTYVAYKFYLIAPNQIPINYDFAGNITNYAVKSIKMFYPTIALQIGLSILMFAVFLVNNKARVDIDPDNINTSGIQTVLYKYRWSIFVYVMGLFLNLMFGFIHIAIFAMFKPIIMTIVPLLFTIIILTYAIILSLKTGQSGNRIQVGKDTKGEVATKKDDDYWVAGLLYYNKNDPSLFIEKRAGIGYTVNFANKISWLLLAVIIAFIALSIYFSINN
ncbi:DUF5808 domain-containing protein [Clostridium sp. 'deep sea']|uniref:DUF1648 domain-containing protein n=1 Tax=Clostridium sp. 'deep sea' TaxID=2779445 RepID=UPI001FAD40C2|nr:DUF5808 domain-containing protein [Clostridium sp. 'deep sea']